MNLSVTTRPNTLGEWAQNWVEVLNVDQPAIDRGITYIYQLLSLPKPTVVFVNGWLECLQELAINHSDTRDFRVDRDSGHNPSFSIKYTDNSFIESSFSRFLWLLREEVSLDWAASKPVYPLEQNKELSRLMHVLLGEIARYEQRWHLLHKQVQELFRQTGSPHSIQNVLSLDMHYLTRQWLQLDATRLANEFYQQTTNTVYNWSLLLDFIKGKSFATYFTHDTVYCVCPPITITNSFLFANGEEYAIPPIP